MKRLKTSETGKHMAVVHERLKIETLVCDDDDDDEYNHNGIAET